MVLELDLLVLWLYNVQEFVLAVIRCLRETEKITCSLPLHLLSFEITQPMMWLLASRLSWFSSFQFPISKYRIQDSAQSAGIGRSWLMATRTSPHRG
jgi:hypothetical protein